MYSTTKNIILKKLKFVIAGLLLITILPGNAGENFNSRNIDYAYTASYKITIETDLNEFKSRNQSSESVPTPEVVMLPDSSANNIPAKVSSFKSFSASKQNCREISPAGKSFNFFMNIQ